MRYQAALRPDMVPNEADAYSSGKRDAIRDGRSAWMPNEGRLDDLCQLCIKLHMVEVRQTAAFTKWMQDLQDRSVRVRILVRIRRLELGNVGDAKPVGDGVSEMRIDHGPGYRVYFVRIGLAVIVLLCGGDKRTQSADIAKAKQLAKEL